MFPIPLAGQDESVYKDATTFKRWLCMNSLEGKVILLTGAANGIGRECAIGLAKLDATICAADIDAGGANKVAETIVSAGGQAEGFALDVTSAPDWQRVIEQIQSRYKALHVLVNNAGVILSRPFLATSVEEFEHIMEVNTTGVFLGCQAAVPLMLESISGNETGSIINLSSVLGLVVQPLSTAYCTSKGATRHLTKALAAELAMGEKKIRVNSLHPGNTRTKLCDTAIEQSLEIMGMADAGLEQGYEMLAQQTPMQRIGAPADMVGAMAFLASDMSQFVTGAELVVDGGYVIT